MDKFFEYINTTEYTGKDLMASLNEKLPDIAPQDLSGKVVIVTGANVGIGYEAAKSVASMKPKLLILACRNAEKANEAINTIKQATGITNIEFGELDLSSYASVKKFAHDFLQKGLPLDILISNAGIAENTKWTLTKDGDEIQLQVNHLANMLLVLLLTPALAKAKSARVCVVASDVHFWANRPAPTDPTPIKTLKEKPDQLFMQQYPSTKLMNVLFVQEYAKRCPHKNITITTANPSLTESELGKKDPTSGELHPEHKGPPMTPRTTYEGAKSIIHASITPDAKNGAYYSEMRPERTRSTVQGEVGAKFGDNVWRDSLEHLQKVTADEKLEDWVNKN